MKKIFTLAAAGMLATASFGAQAQVTVDGQLTAPEITAGNYVLIGKYTNPRGFGDAGLLSLYAASTSTKVYFFLGGTVETNGNAFQLFLDLPATTGVPVGTALPAGSSGTSFEKMKAKMDLPVDLALALRSDGTGFKIEGATYTPVLATSKNLTGTTPLTGNGDILTLPTDAAFPMLAMAKVAYKNATGGKVSANPGNTTPNTAAAYGGVGTFGLEVELDRAALGATGTPALTVFALQNGGDGGFLSSDYIPQTTAPTGNGNLGDASLVDFATVAGRQAATFTLSATGVVLANKAADAAALAMQVYPNPASGFATVEYNVGSRAENVSVMLTDLLGRNIQALTSGLQSAGKHTTPVSTINVAAGTYLVRVQVGDKVSTRKVVLL